MTVELSYDVKGYNRVRNALRKMASEYREEIDETVQDFAKDQRANLKSFRYPEPRRISQPFKTDKQRRWFFFALRTGLISVPYVRTGVLASSWRAESSGWAEWSVVNSAAYSALVVGRGTQVRYHKDHWWIAQDVIEENTPELTKNLSDEILELADGMEGTP